MDGPLYAQNWQIPSSNVLYFRISRPQTTEGRLEILFHRPRGLHIYCVLNYVPNRAISDGPPRSQAVVEVEHDGPEVAVNN